MAQLAKTARMKIRVGSKTLDTNDVTLRSPLDEQVMLVWYTARARVAAADNAEESDGGVSGNLNMHWHIKDLFGCTDDDARYASSRIRQVLKKVSAARNISPGGAGHSPIWWISDTLPDNIVTVAEWVTANHKTVDPQREGYKVKPTRAEKRLSEHEAGEDRLPAPVTVTKTETGEETVTATFTELADPPAQDIEIAEVDVEGPVDTSLRAVRSNRELLFADIRKTIKKHGPMTALECAAVLRAEQPNDERWQIDPTTFREYLAKMHGTGTVHARLETRGERNIRQLLDRTAYFGKFSQLWSVYPNPTERHHAFNVETGLRFTAADIITPVPVPDSRSNPLVNGQLVEAGAGPVTVVINNVQPTAPAHASFREKILDLGAAAVALAAEMPDMAELDDLRVMNSLLEEENVKLRAEVEELREVNEKEKKRAAQVRALYGG